MNLSDRLEAARGRTVTPQVPAMSAPAGPAPRPVTVPAPAPVPDALAKLKDNSL